MPVAIFGFRKVSASTWRTIAVIALALMAVVALFAYIKSRMRLTDEQLEARIISTIQSEAPRSFLVTGSVDLTATVTVTNAKTLLPGLLDVNLGRARAMVQVPGRAYYGFDVRALDGSRINIKGDTVSIEIPRLTVLSVDSNLEDMRVWSGKGWLRSNASRTNVEQSALKRVDGALRRQAEAHVAMSTQPRVNTADAIKKSLTPVLRASGVEPVYRFQLTERLRLE